MKKLITAKSREDEKPLREYQQKVIDVLKKMDEEESFSTIVNIPTGGGKTVIANRFCRDVLEKGSKVLWLADRKKLLEQAVNSFKSVYTELEYSYQVICGSKENIQIKTEGINDIEKSSNILFCSVATIIGVSSEVSELFAAWLKNDKKKLYIVYDEAHHIGANNVQKFFESVIGTTTIYGIKKFGLIGLTATVYYGGTNFIKDVERVSQTAMDIKVDAFNAWFKHGWDGEKVVKIDTGYGDYTDSEVSNVIAPITIKELIENGYLIEPELYKVKEFEAGVPKKAAGTLEVPDNVSKELDNAQKLNLKYLASRIKQYHKEWGKTVVFVDTINSANYLVDLLMSKAYGVRAFAYTSKSRSNPGDEGKFEEFCKNKDAEYNILVSVDILSEGVDIPALETIYLFNPVYSQVRLRQRIGRVLRKPEDGSKIARVVWQYYPDKPSEVSDEEFEKLVSNPEELKVQTDSEKAEDVATWRKGRQLPAAMYKEELTERTDSTYKFSEFVILNILNLFELSEIEQSDSVGYYKSSENDNVQDFIYVTDREKNGYDQLYRMIDSDWVGLLRFNKCSGFGDYAKLLNLEEGDLLDYIKKVCFYLSDVQKRDTSGKRLKKRFRVTDEQIKKFCNWYLKGEVEYVGVSVPENTANKDTAGNGVSGIGNMEVSNGTKKDYSRFKKEISKYHKQKLEHKDLSSQENKEKQYTDMMLYKENTMEQEILSLKSCMRQGAIDVPRYKENGIALAFRCFENGEYKSAVKILPKREISRKIFESDFFNIASALVEVPNHIVVEEKDVNEYKHFMKKYFEGAGYDVVRLAKEFLMALGYYDNDKIIKEQCRMCKDKEIKVPRILQYLIYQKAYKELIDVVSFVKGNKLVAVCTNKKELKARYSEILNHYGVSKLDNDLAVVSDIIYDYRPYLKAIPYYQGIKSEFLCRMVNDTIQMLPEADKVDCVIDAFGGSGAYTMNGFFKNIKPARVFNDLGIMNAVFYNCLLENKKELEKTIGGIFDKAFSDYNEENETQDFFFEEFIDWLNEQINKPEGTEEFKDLCKSAKEYLEKSVEKCENDYLEKMRKAENIKVDDARKKLTDRLSKEYAVYYNVTGLKNLDIKSHCHKVEKYMHVFMLKVARVYRVLINFSGKDDTEKDNTGKDNTGKVEIGIGNDKIAAVFFLYNTLSYRHFYSDCRISSICNAMLQYKKWFKWGTQCFDGVKIRQKDALKLFDVEPSYNNKNTVYYADIPYAESRTDNYVAEWFDNDEFLKVLSKFEGTYIVSSRCNVCLPKKGKKEYLIKRNIVSAHDNEERVTYERNSVFKQIKAGKEESKTDKEEPKAGKEEPKTDKEEPKTDKEEPKTDKNDRMFRFFNGFVTAKHAEIYEGEDSNLYHIKPGHEAKYIIIPVTKMEEILETREAENKGKDEDKDKKKLIFKKVVRNAVLDEKSIERMLIATHFSQIPVEVMITNADLDIEKPIVRKISDDMYAVPTFKTGIDSSQYYVEPVNVVIKYEKFIKILLKLMFKEKYDRVVKYESEKETKNAVLYFRDLLNSMKADSQS